ncbi:MAG: response regulator [Caulobacter sp.]|nr:response regulator [Caulobacter sp.]
MFAVLSCVSHQHDLRLVLIALVICVAAIITAFGLFDRAQRATGGFSRGWVLLAGLIAGSGIWTTHFLAMLAYQPDLIIGFDFAGTALSLLASVFAMTLAFGAPVVAPGPTGQIAAGVIAGLGMAVMHFTGMSALQIQAIIQWDLATAVSAVVVGTGLAVVAFRLFGQHQTVARRTLAGLLFVLSILALHFTGMTAVVLIPDGTVFLSSEALDRNDLAMIITALASGLLLACLGLLWVESQSQRSTLSSLRSSLDALPTGLAFFDARSRLVVWNTAFAELMVMRKAMPARGMPLSILTAACRGSTDGKTVNEQRWSDGRWIRVKAGPTPDGGAVILLRDITDDKVQAEAMMAARDAAQAANRAKSEFLANMSHEIRTPLNGVLGAADLLAREPLGAHQAELVQMIHASGQSLNRLLSDIIDLARVETGKLQVTAEDFDLAEAVDTAAALFGLKAAEKGIDFRVEIAPDAHGAVVGDPVRLRQVLGNLLSNAVKFTERGAVSLRVDRPDGASGPYRFTVTDTGIGFDEATRARLFQRFEQGNGDVARRFGGSGLGLSICRELARLMGGDIVCDSAPGAGATFTVTLPFAAAAERAPKAASISLAAGAGTPMRVLVVDDHPNNRRFLEMLLEHAGVEAVCANDGRAGLEAWQSGDFDAVLMDMQMPVMDGLEATRAIRDHERAAGSGHTPVIVISANAMPEHRQASEDAGADLHLSKPINAAELLAALAALDPVAERAVA